jgi:hypothetical protein
VASAKEQMAAEAAVGLKRFAAGVEGMKEILPIKVRRPSKPLSDPAKAYDGDSAKSRNLIFATLDVRLRLYWESAAAAFAAFDGQRADQGRYFESAFSQSQRQGHRRLRVSAELHKALGTNPSTGLHLFKVVEAYWRFCSYFCEQPSEKSVAELRKPIEAITKAGGWRVRYEQVNPK